MLLCSNCIESRSTAQLSTCQAVIAAVAAVAVAAVAVVLERGATNSLTIHLGGIHLSNMVVNEHMHWNIKCCIENRTYPLLADLTPI